MGTVGLIAWAIGPAWFVLIVAVAAVALYARSISLGVRWTKCFLRRPTYIVGFWAVVAAIDAYWIFVLGQQPTERLTGLRGSGRLRRLSAAWPHETRRGRLAASPTCVARLQAWGGEHRLAEVRVGENETFESALRRFNKKIQQSGILAEARRREHYEKPSVKRKRKEAKRKKNARTQAG